MHRTSGVRETARRIRSSLSAYAVPIWTVLLLLFTGTFIFRQRSDISQFERALTNSDLKWVTIAILIQFVILGLFALTYHGLLKRLGHGLSRLRLFEIHLRRHVVGTVTPIGGPASVYVFVRSLGAHGVSSNDALLTTALRSMSGYASFVVLFIPIVLVSRPTLPFILGASIVAALFMVLLGVLMALLWSNELPGWFAARSPERALSFVEQVREHGIGLRDLGRPILLSLAANIAGVATMYFSLLAIGFQASPTTVLFAYATGILMLTIAPVFQGIGVVEVTMAASLQHMGVPATSAVAATLLFRFFDVWLPLISGLIVQLAQSSALRQAMSYNPVEAFGFNRLVGSRRRIPGPRIAAAGAFIAIIPGFLLIAPDRFLPFS